MPFMPLAAMGLLATVMLIVWLAPCARRSTGDGWTLTVEGLRTQLSQMEARLRDQASTAADGQARLQAKVEALEQANVGLRTSAQAAESELRDAQAQLATSQADVLRNRIEAETLREVLQRLTPAEAAPAPKSPKARRG